MPQKILELQKKRAEYESRIQLAIHALDIESCSSVRKAARLYNVKESTLCGRRKGVVCKSESYADRCELTKVEEEELPERMGDMMYLGLAPQRLHIRNMADGILAGRGSTTPITVGNKWVDNFIARSGNLKVRLSRPKDRKRLLAENPEIMAEWFRLVRRTIHTPPGSPVSGDAESDPETPKNIKELHRHRDITDKLSTSGDASPRVLQRRYHQSIKKNPRKTRATGQRKC